MYETIRYRIYDRLIRCSYTPCSVKIRPTQLLTCCSGDSFLQLCPLLICCLIPVDRCWFGCSSVWQNLDVIRDSYFRLANSCRTGRWNLRPSGISIRLCHCHFPIHRRGMPRHFMVGDFFVGSRLRHGHWGAASLSAFSDVSDNQWVIVCRLEHAVAIFAVLAEP